MQRLELTLERFDTCSDDAETIVERTLEQHTQGEPFPTASDGPSQSGVGKIGLAYGALVIVIDDAVMVQVLIFQVACLYRDISAWHCWSVRSS